MVALCMMQRSSQLAAIRARSRICARGRVGTAHEASGGHGPTFTLSAADTDASAFPAEYRLGASTTAACAGRRHHSDMAGEAGGTQRASPRWRACMRFRAAWAATSTARSISLQRPSAPPRRTCSGSARTPHEQRLAGLGELEEHAPRPGALRRARGEHIGGAS
jgi:hypothetical protein